MRTQYSMSDLTLFLSKHILKMCLLRLYIMIWWCVSWRKLKYIYFIPFMCNLRSDFPSSLLLQRIFGWHWVLLNNESLYHFVGRYWITLILFRLYNIIELNIYLMQGKMGSQKKTGSLQCIVPTSRWMWCMMAMKSIE